MNTYEVTFQAISPAFKNSEIEITSEKADIIREELRKALKAREPVVYGRDWFYDAVSVRDTMIVEGDYYSVSNNGTAHFYQEPSQAPSTSVLSVIHVRKLPQAQTSEVSWSVGYSGGGSDGVIPLSTMTTVAAATGAVPQEVMKQVVNEMDKGAENLTWAQSSKNFEDLFEAIMANPKWKSMLRKTTRTAGDKRMDIRQIRPSAASEPHSER